MAPSSDLQAYLAAKYMSGAKADAINAREAARKSGKKKKRKTEGESAATTGAGFIHDDDALLGWGANTKEEDDDAAPVVEERDNSFKSKGAATAWSVVRPAIAKQEAEEPPIPEDEKPQVVAPEDSAAPAAFVGGLQTPEQIKAQAEEQRLRRLAADQARAKARQRGEAGDREDEEANGEETVYRDGSGRKIDTKKAKAEEKRRQERELEKAMQKMEWGKGLVQRENKDQRRKEMEEIVKKPFARHVDDEEMNEELKDVQRWNDPAAKFLTNTKKSKKSNRPKYNGPPPPPNRYGIPPGYRWDGVDRSNGFERQLAQKGNERKRRTLEAHQYSVDEM